MSIRRDYLPLFSIRAVQQGSAGVINNVTMAPTMQCRTLLNDHQLLAKQREFGMQVYFSNNPWATNPLLGAISSRVRFDFKVIVPVDFYTTYLPDVESGKKLHLNNLTAAGSIKPGTDVALSANASVTDVDALKIVAQRFEIELTPPVGAVSYDVRNQFGTQVLRNFPLDELGEGERIEFDLDGLPYGRYRLAPDNVPSQETEFFVENEVASQRCQAVVSIFLETPQTGAPATGYQFNAHFDVR